MNQSILANLILNQYFLSFRCLVILTEHPANFKYTGKQQIINLSIEFSRNNTVLINDFITTKYHGCQGIVVDTSKPVEIFEFLEAKIRKSMLRFQSRRYFFIVRNKAESSTLEFVTEALTYVADVLFLFCKNEGELEMWTHKYVGVTDINSLIFLDKWFPKNQSFLFGNDLYPDKLSSQHGRKLTLTCMRYPPYTFCDQDLSYDQYYGTELRAAVEYAKVHNMTIDIKYNEHKDELWGEIFPNWTGSGLMGNILADSADIGLASFDALEFANTYLDMSAPYIRTGICCLVPRPESFDGWFIPLLSYTKGLWIAILINFVIDVVAISLIDYYCEKHNGFNLKIMYRIILKSIWIVLGISLGQVLVKSSKQKYLPIRIIFLVLFLMYLILDSTFYSGLASIMTKPRTQPPINTVADLAQHNINIYGLSSAWIFPIEKSDNEIDLKILKNFKTATVQQRELSKHKKNAFMIERLPFNGYAISDYIQKDVIENYHLMEEDLFWDYTRFYLRKSSILAPSFDRFISRLVETGLPSRWQGEAIYNFMDFVLQRMIYIMDKQIKPTRDVLKLKIFHVKGAFGLLIIGYVFSGMTLLIENLYFKFNENLVAKRT